MTRRWTSPDDIAGKVRRRWDDGTLLRAHADAKPFEPIEIPLRGPTASQIGEDLGAARDWVTVMDSGRQGDRRYALVWQSVGGRHVGRNQLPSRAVVSTFDQAWALLGVSPAVRQFDELLESASAHPAVRDWMLRYPLRALELGPEMPRLIAAYAWLNTHRDSHRYLREISAPGVDTKFAERHRPVLAAMLGVSSTASGFLSGLGLQTKPESVRLRPSASMGLPAALTEITVRTDELARLAVQPRTALVIENEITYLCVDVPDDGVVLWGKGFEVDRIGRLPWLAGVPIRYWGDLDTHGFAILDRLRAWLPQTESVLMDRETLVAHRDRWVIEQRPASSDLVRLTPTERDLYTDLVMDALGERVRLEQERIDWAWAQERLG
ncbi:MULTISPECIES: Wadjet anti-phage system protein JetD domain-containing protein [Gordonia]|uniref:DUF2220 family protein n=1 Tax=Gordonia amicalis TaxID=89053 RepID=A0AAE4R2A9_9ACTN|nr:MULTISPECIES: DUF3322 and DUF2220 domain-containing protein [Gordonia]ATD70008.1 hypothetical protein CNO18_06720 [Gordonia sp. 1D]KAF0969687.1 hypothetical protein BPODLACK_01972 [Gordonia sp. YY1]MBA5845982.1 hypothetical protein [Gordonia amicalis]MCZ4578883.1 DUF2220 family protein [Gordonia amicalis]MCZ4651793.1 DUF2220 family protein [Gordonia amicalis]